MVCSEDSSVRVEGGGATFPMMGTEERGYRGSLLHGMMWGGEGDGGVESDEE